jgi:16S rRNA processing protein RimM
MPTAGDRSSRRGEDSRTVPAGRVGRAHGLDGSFYVTGARVRLLALGIELDVAGGSAKVVRRAGTDAHPIVRLSGIEDRRAIEELRGQELTVAQAQAPALEDGEWWASELEGCEVVDGTRHIGTVTRLVELPSCEALEVRLAKSDSEDVARSARDLLVPMVRDAIRRVDPVERRIDVDMSFLAE